LFWGELNLSNTELHEQCVAVFGRASGIGLVIGGMTLAVVASVRAALSQFRTGRAAVARPRYATDAEAGVGYETDLAASSQPRAAHVGSAVGNSGIFEPRTGSTPTAFAASCQVLARSRGAGLRLAAFKGRSPAETKSSQIDYLYGEELLTGLGIRHELIIA